jgi:hypothetical protein
MNKDQNAALLSGDHMRIEEIHIGDSVEIFTIDGDGSEHQILPGVLVAVFRSGWDSNLRCVVEHVGNEHIIKTSHRKNVRRLNQGGGRV